MPDQSPPFREQLLDSQPMSPELRDEYRKALQALQRHTLTPRTRLITWLIFLGCVVGGAICAGAVWVHRAKTDSLIILPVFTAVCLAAAVWLARVLRAGGYEHRASFAVIERLGGIASGVFVAVVLLRGINHPTEPASIFGAIIAVLLVMVGFAWGTGNRIAAATLETREHLLRLESRLADLAERLPKH